MKTKTLKFTLMLILTIAIAACEQQADGHRRPIETHPYGRKLITRR